MMRESPQPHELHEQPKHSPEEIARLISEGADFDIGSLEMRGYQDEHLNMTLAIKKKGMRPDRDDFIKLPVADFARTTSGGRTESPHCIRPVAKRLDDEMLSRVLQELMPDEHAQGREGSLNITSLLALWSETILQTESLARSEKPKICFVYRQIAAGEENDWGLKFSSEAYKSIEDVYLISDEGVPVFVETSAALTVEEREQPIALQRKCLTKKLQYLQELEGYVQKELTVSEEIAAESEYPETVEAYTKNEEAFFAIKNSLPKCNELVATRLEATDPTKGEYAEIPKRLKDIQTILEEAATQRKLVESKGSLGYFSNLDFEAKSAFSKAEEAYAEGNDWISKATLEDCETKARAYLAEIHEQLNYKEREKEKRQKIRPALAEFVAQHPTRDTRLFFDTQDALGEPRTTQAQLDKLYERLERSRAPKETPVATPRAESTPTPEPTTAAAPADLSSFQAAFAGKFGNKKKPSK